MRGRLQSILARAPREGIRTLYNKCDPVLLSVLDGIEKLEIKVGIRSDGDGPKIFVARRTFDSGFCFSGNVREWTDQPRVK